MNTNSSCSFIELLILLCCLFAVNSFQIGPIISRRCHHPAATNPSSVIDASLSNDDSSSTEQHLLQSLEESLDYEGRLPSKVSSEDDFHCGFVSIIGAANMGKSTLLNGLLQQDLSVATRRPQTTRHAILGVLTSSTTQLLLMDTPGILQTAAYKLQEGMMEAVAGAVNSADVLLVVTDLFSTPIPNDALFAKVQKLNKPKIVVINKVDLVDKVNPTKDENNGDNDNKTVTIEEAVAKWRILLPDALLILPVSASTGKGVTLLRDVLLAQGDIPAALRDLGRPILGMFRNGQTTLSQQEVRELLPKSPPLYHEDTLTDRSERFFASEMIRASLFQNLKKELPYCCEVQVTEFKRKQKAISIQANIFVERDSQKVIVVGKGGQVIKQVGIDARKELQDFFESKVHLELIVKVDKDWRKNESRLKELGYLK